MPLSGGQHPCLLKQLTGSSLFRASIDGLSQGKISRDQAALPDFQDPSGPVNDGCMLLSRSTLAMQVGGVM
jgi:hypothetical protein